MEKNLENLTTLAEKQTQLKADLEVNSNSHLTKNASLTEKVFYKDSLNADNAMWGNGIHYVTVIGDDNAIVSIIFANGDADPAINFRPPIFHMSRRGCQCGQHTLIQSSSSESHMEDVVLQLAFDIDLKDVIVPANVKVIQWSNDIVTVK